MASGGEKNAETEGTAALKAAAGAVLPPASGSAEPAASADTAGPDEAIADVVAVPAETAASDHAPADPLRAEAEIPSATPAARDPSNRAVAETGTRETQAHDDLGALRFQASWLEEPPRPMIEQVRAPVAFLLAAGVHVGLVMMLGGTSATAQLGAGGDDTLSISIEVVSASELAKGIRSVEGERPRDSASGTIANPAGSTVDSAASSAQAESRLQVSEAETEASAAAPQASSPLPTDRDTDDQSPVLPAAEQPSSEVRQTGQPEPSEADQVHAAPTAAQADEPNPNPAQQRTEVASVSSAPSDQAAASVLGGGATGPDASPLEASVTARLAAGLAARAYSADVVKSLAELEAFLNSANRQRGSTVRGTVRLLLTIGSNGLAERVTVEQSSGEASLDARAVQDLAQFRFPPAPAGLSAAQRTYTLPITYR